MEDQLQEILRSPQGGPTTLDAQQLANSEKETWSVECAVGKEFQEPDWAGWEQGDVPPPELFLEVLKRALSTFPAMTGLGWDTCHPRALLRLRDEVIRIIIGVLQRCEREGAWPEIVRLIIIVLLPKSDQGRRSIGLLPLLPGVWMRSRSDVVRKWEAEKRIFVGVCGRGQRG